MHHLGRITTRTLLMLLTGFICQYSVAQKIIIQSATQQGWAGGVCCVHGVNYTVNVQVILSKRPITFDTLWTEGYCHSLAAYNLRTFVANDTFNLQLYEGISFNNQKIYSVEQQRDIIVPCYTSNITGIKLQYTIGDKKYWLDITPFIKELDFLAFP